MAVRDESIAELPIASAKTTPSTAVGHGWPLAAAVIFVLLAFDLAVPSMLDTQAEWLYVICLGIVVGQLNLIALWAALAPGNVVVRLPWSMLLAVAVWYALVLGMRAGSGWGLGEALTLGALLLGAVAVIQIPLWSAGRAFGWRLTAAERTPGRGDRGPLQFELRHMFLGTALVAAALAPARAVLPPGRGADVSLETSLFWPAAIMLLVNLAVVAPCIWLAFASRLRTARLVLGWAAYTAVLTCFEIAGFVVFARVPPSSLDLLEGCLFLYIFNLAQCATVVGVLLLFRRAGYRLVRASAAVKIRSHWS